MAQDGSTFHTHRNHVLHYYPKESKSFPYLRRYHSPPSVLKNHDTDSYQDISFNSPPPDDDNPLENFQPHTSIKPIANQNQYLTFLLFIEIFLVHLLHMIILMIL